ncbi:MAG: hypothetical protein U0470_11815 [Anaerolineae bacterium]
MTDPMVPKYVAVLIVAFVFVVLVALWAVHPPDAEYRERMLRLAVTGHSSRIGARVGAAINPAHPDHRHRPRFWSAGVEEAVMGGSPRPAAHRLEHCRTSGCILPERRITDVEVEMSTRHQARWSSLVCSAALVATTAACAAQSGSLGGAAVPAATMDAQSQPPADPATVDPSPAESTTIDGVATGAIGDAQVAAGVPVSDELAAAQAAPVDAAADPNAAPTVAPVSPVVALPTGFQIAGFARGGLPAVDVDRLDQLWPDLDRVPGQVRRLAQPGSRPVHGPTHGERSGPYAVHTGRLQAELRAARGAPVRPGDVQRPPERDGLNALVDFSWTIPAAPPATLNRPHKYAGGSVVWNNAVGDFVFQANAVLPFSACSSQPTTQTISLMIDLAAASNYVIPWPPQPFEQNERLFLNAIRFAPEISGAC